MTRRHPFPLAVRALLLFALCALPLAASAQTSTATLSGTVTDPNGAVVPGVIVTVTDPATRLQRTTTTNDAGQFAIPLLPPSKYNLTLEHQGFMTAAINDVVLNVNDERALRIQMRVGNVSETVNITGETPLINESPAVGTIVDRQFVENIPLNGRSFQSLIAMTPGVVAVPGATLSGNKGEFSINGQRAESNYYSIDGVSANTGAGIGTAAPQGANGGLPGETALSTTQSLVSLDALQEFRIQTSSYAAEYGRTPGGQISFATRSGANDWHGSAFDYLRNDVLDANNWFNNANRIAKTVERQNDFGGTFSGPILFPRFGEGGRQPWYNGRNRTFFFFSYEGLRLITPKPATTTFVPDLCLRGVTAQCTGTDKPAAAALQKFLNAFPLPNGPENGTTGMAQFIAAVSLPGSLDATSIRIDHSFNDKFTLFGRYNNSPSKTLTTGGATTLSSQVISSRTVRTLTIGSTNLLGAHVANQFRFNVSSNTARSAQSMSNFGGAIPFDLSGLTDSAGLPTPGLDSLTLVLTLAGNTQYSISTLTSPQREYNYVDTVTYSVGQHALKWGIDYRQLTTPQTFPKLSESVVFSTKAQLQSGIPPSVSVSAVPNPIAPRYKNLSLFGQDEWKVRPRLSLTLGLRWEWNPAPTDAFGNLPFTLDQVTNFATSQIAPKGTPLWKTTHNNFAPRFGAAYQLRRTPGRETVLRGGFGIFYDMGNNFGSAGYSGPGIRSSSTIANVPFPLTAAQLTVPAPSLAPPYTGAITTFDPGLKLPYTLEWNMTVEQALGTNQALTVSYVGAAGRRLLLSRAIFPATLGNKNFSSSGGIFFYRNGATSDYDALQVQFQRRLSRGLQALASYTWSHSIDESSTNNTSLQLLRASSDFDIRHNFQTALTYDLPGKFDNVVANAVLRHWSLDARVSARSALPFDVSGGSFTDATGTAQQLRADIVPGQPVYVSDPTAPGGRRVNFSAFTVPTAAEKAAGQYGNAPRNFLRAFPAWQVDFALRREFPIHERLKLQFRAEAFNILNHPIFGAIQNNLSTGSAVFGRATGTLNSQLGGLNSLYQQGGPRSFQFALRLVF